MNKETPMGFILAIVSGICFVVAAASGYLVETVPLIWQISLGLAVVSGIAHFWVLRQSYGEVFSKRTTKYGLNSIVMSVLALAVVGALNYTINLHDVKKDFTKAKIHSLSDETVKLLKGLKSEVKLRVFVAPPNHPQEFDEVLDMYTYQSPLIKKEYIDVDKEPQVTKKYNIKENKTILVETENRTARIENLFQGAQDPKIEEKITNAIVNVTKGEKKKIYALSGHGERLPTDTSRGGLSDFKESLEAVRFKVEELSLLDKDKVPEDAEILMITGPKNEFVEHELKAIETYVNGGGKLFLMLDANSPVSLKAFVAKYGVEWKPKKTVAETNPIQQLAGGNPLAPVIVSYSSTSDITKEAKQASIMPFPTPVAKAATVPKDDKVESLFSTSAKSFEVDFPKGDKLRLDTSKDPKGPFSLAVTVSGKAITAAATPPADATKKDEKKPEEKKDTTKAKDSEFRMVVVGDADFATNGVIKFLMNSDLAQNMVSWLAKEEDLISIRPRPTGLSDFNITVERYRIIYAASVFFLPLSVLMTGFVVWWRRRKM